MRGGSAVADSSTGPSSRNENGFCSPPVRNSRIAISAMSKANSQAARSGSIRCVTRKRTRSATLSQAGERDHGQAGPDRQLEIEPEIDHQHRRGLADHRDPAQPHQRVEAHIAPRPAGVFVQLDRHGGVLPVRALRSSVVDCPANRQTARACIGEGLRQGGQQRHI